jgi:hypothetical protein
MAKHKNTRRGTGSQMASELSRHPTLSGIRIRNGHDSIVRPRLKPKTQAQLDWSRGRRVR